MNKEKLHIIIMLIIGILLTIICYQLFTVKEYKETKNGNYVCNGKIIKICSGSNEINEIRK